MHDRIDAHVKVNLQPAVLHRFFCGSGRPVLTLDGKVAAINSAILAGYDGSNLGVPVGFGHDMIDQVNQ
jgi:hypothetical protein